MKAVGYLNTGPIERAESLIDIELPEPQPGLHDLRVNVAAVSVNPVDTKIRVRRAPQGGQPDVLGWDAVGTVDAVGSEVRDFAVGDRVWYAGQINRPGSNAQLHLVDARIASKAPQSLSDAQAAAMPLTAITAWELLFDRLGVARSNASEGGEGGTLLVVGGAGGVGSVLIQLARRLTGLTVVATASRPETQAWCRDLGAHHVIDHTQPLLPQLQALGIAAATHVAALTQTEKHWAALAELTAPQGRIALIDDPAQPLDIMLLKSKSISLHWELMFTRSIYQTPDMAEQGRLLAEVAALVDAGALRTTLAQTLHPISAASLKEAHALVESGRMRGKVVVQGWA